MRTLLILFMVILASTYLLGQACPIDDRHLDIEITSLKENVPCKFELVYVSFKKDQPVKVEQIAETAPYKLTIQGRLGYLVIQGLSGDGKVVSHYKVTQEEKRQSDYLHQGEIVSLAYTPRGAGSPNRTYWISNTSKTVVPLMTEITMIRLANE